MILGKKETKKGNGLHFCEVVYIEELCKKVIPNIDEQAPYHTVFQKRATITGIV